MALRYIVYIKDTFWEKLFADEKVVKDDEKLPAGKSFLMT